MLVAAVGTFIAGFDQLVTAADRTCADLDLDGFAQIGQSAVEPRAMRWERFLPQAELGDRFRAARVVVCHAGMGIVGEAMRAGVPVVLFPRKGDTRKRHPANDQTAFARTIAARHGLALCEDGRALPDVVAGVLRGPSRRHYELATDVPVILAAWLSGCPTAPGSSR